jgi:hypothetical protein
MTKVVILASLAAWSILAYWAATSTHDYLHLIVRSLP